MIVGEAPGDNEDKTGKPFRGDAGANLNKLLEKVGIDRNTVFVTNVVKCRPVDGNRNRKPKPEEVNSCLPYLTRQLKLVRPGITVLLGATALNAFFPNKKIGDVHGQVLARDGQQFFATYHPAAQIYNKELGPVMEEDFHTLSRLIKTHL